MKNRINELRKNKGLTLKAFASELNKFTERDRNNVNTVTYSTISRWEKGITEPSLAMWQKMSDYFGVSIGYLQGENSDDSEKKIIDTYLLYFNLEVELLKKGMSLKWQKNISDRDLKLIFSGMDASKELSNLARDLMLMPKNKNLGREEIEEFVDFTHTDKLDEMLDKILSALDTSL